MTIAIVYDITGKMIGTVGGADSGILTGDYTRNPFAIGAGTIAGAACRQCYRFSVGRTKKRNLKKTGVNNNEK